MKIPASPYTCEEVVKKSRFAVNIYPLTDSGEFDEILKQCADPSANHNCWAWKIDNNYRYSDDGEPSGTAGKPILQAIESQDWTGIAVIVIRYFGGIKLGAGGLIRAYNGISARALQEAPFETLIKMREVKVSVSHEYTGKLYSLLRRFTITDEEVFYSGNHIIMNIRIPSDAVEEFTDACIDLTSGNAVVKCL